MRNKISATWRFVKDDEKRLRFCLRMAGTQPQRGICELLLATGHGNPAEVAKMLGCAYHSAWQTMQRMERAGVLESRKLKGDFRDYVVLSSPATRNLRYFMENFEISTL